MQGVPTVSVRREAARLWSLRKFNVEIDGHQAGHLGRGGTLALDLNRGWHTALVCVGLTRSDELRFEVPDTGTALDVRVIGTRLQIVRSGHTEKPARHDPAIIDVFPRGRGFLYLGIISLAIGIVELALLGPLTGKAHTYLFGLLLLIFGVFYLARHRAANRGRNAPTDENDSQ